MTYSVVAQTYNAVQFTGDNDADILEFLGGSNQVFGSDSNGVRHLSSFGILGMPDKQIYEVDTDYWIVAIRSSPLGTLLPRAIEAQVAYNELDSFCVMAPGDFTSYFGS